MTKITIAVDAMGGDHGPSVTVPASLQVLADNTEVCLILVGDEGALKSALLSHPGYDQARLIIHHASQKVEMDESPAQALRSKKDSSMRVAVNLVKEGQAQACVSAGNTGALVATARFVLKTLPGIDRPAIISTFPTVNSKRNVRMLDLGANVDSTPEHLLQFAVMGSVLAAAVDNLENPKVCLLNIGEEDIKGNELVKQTAQLFNNNLKAINYSGFVEGDQIFKERADVIVCDGFVGNVALKTSEGVAAFFARVLREAFMRTWLTRIAGFIAKPVLKSLIKRIDPDRYNGATLIGLQGIVIKSHGGAKAHAFQCAIEEAMVQVQENVTQQINLKVAEILKSITPE